MFQKFPQFSKMGLVLGVLFILIILSFISRPNPLNSSVQDLIREASQAHEISKQDSDPAVSLMHATEALAYLSTCRKLASDASIFHHAKVSASELEKIFKDRQADAIQKLGKIETSVAAILAGYK